MPVITTLAYAIQGLLAIEQLIAAKIDVSTRLAALRAQLQTFQDENRDPTQEEWDAQDAEISAKLAQLNG